MTEPSGLLLLSTAATAATAASHATSPLTDAALIACAAALFATVFQRLGLPLVTGYLLAGLAVGVAAHLAFFAVVPLTAVHYVPSVFGLASNAPALSAPRT